MLFYFKYYTTTSKNCCILTNYITTEKLRTNKYVEHLLPQNDQQSFFQFHDIQLLGILLVSHCRKKSFHVVMPDIFLRAAATKVTGWDTFFFTFPTPSPFFYFLQLHFVKICCDINIHWIASITWLNPLLFWILISISDHLMVVQMTYWWSVAD